MTNRTRLDDLVSTTSYIHNIVIITGDVAPRLATWLSG